MEFRYKLDSVIIKEPVGFDDFSSKLVRNSKHGISAEFSDKELEFDRKASAIIREAYNNIGIDAELILLVEQTCNGTDWIEVYKGVLDLAEYVDLKDKYRRVKCKTGQVGVMTTFNNRCSMSVMLDSNKGQDGANIPVYANLNKEILMPSKKVVLKTIAANNEDAYYNNLFEKTIVASHGEQNTYITVDIPFINTESSDIGTFYSLGAPKVTNHYSEYPKGNPMILFTDDELSKYGDTFKIKGNLAIDINIIYPYNYSEINEQTGHFHREFILSNGEDIIVISSHDEVIDYKSSQYPPVLDWNTSISITIPEIVLNKRANLYFQMRMKFTYNRVYGIGAAINIKKMCIYGAEKGSESEALRSNIDISTLSEYPDSRHNVCMIHEALSHITESISNGKLNIKSDWYGRPDSEVNPTGIYGGGSLRCITNGLRMRNAVLPGGKSTFFSVSMNDLYNGLNAIDNLGIGFSEENGKLYVRVEPWEWFYKDEVILTINNPASLERSVDVMALYSILKIGYKKYVDNKDSNWIDTFMTEREYTSKLKLVNNKLEQLSNFVADPYAIEYTRRKTLEKDTKDWTYDNDIFIICLVADIVSGVKSIIVDLGVEGTDGSVVSPETMYNVRISPARNAIRWANRILNFTGSNKLHLSSAIGNAIAKGKAVNIASKDGHQYEYGYDCGEVVSESDEIDFIKGPIIKPEILKLEYPISSKQYALLKKKPYGQIIVDGEVCYLKDVEYKYRDGLAKFTLTPSF